MSLLDICYYLKKIIFFKIRRGQFSRMYKKIKSEMSLINSLKKRKAEFYNRDGDVNSRWGFGKFFTGSLWVD